MRSANRALVSSSAGFGRLRTAGQNIEIGNAGWLNALAAHRIEFAIGTQDFRHPCRPAHCKQFGKTRLSHVRINDQNAFPSLRVRDRQVRKHRRLAVVGFRTGNRQSMQILIGKSQRRTQCPECFALNGSRIDMRMNGIGTDFCFDV